MLMNKKNQTKVANGFKNSHKHYLFMKYFNKILLFKYFKSCKISHKFQDLTIHETEL